MVFVLVQESLHEVSRPENLYRSGGWEDNQGQGHLKPELASPSSALCWYHHAESIGAEEPLLLRILTTLSSSFIWPLIYATW